MQGSDGRGTHHFRGEGTIRYGRGAGLRRAIRRAALVLALMGGQAAASVAISTAALAQDDPAVQRGVPAEATAANAVLAKERAIANAQRIAYQRYAAAIGRDPNASQSTIESLVTSMVVEQERSTLNGYSGRYTIRFRGAASSSSGASASAGTGSAPSAGRASSSDNAAYVPPSGPPLNPMTALLDARTSFRSLEEWLALRGRLLAQPSVGSVEILAISTEGARLRIGLRSPPGVAAQELAAGGIALVPAQPPVAGVPGPAPGSDWRVGFAGGA
ncbi:hypothetical protein [Roseomonas populi]|uniref:DUF2066 domain-containing protein n=1 Tax=Roseomonas populi TaxID=3121582 RepID=A0ABT1X4P3_9PROT|nr:hypothetical protein [Roseomonas pecuniae]MCR0983052.1 hypothetical protein [Roseomonas pecuniae]